MAERQEATVAEGGLYAAKDPAIKSIRVLSINVGEVHFKYDPTGIARETVLDACLFKTEVELDVGSPFGKVRKTMGLGEVAAMLAPGLAR